MGFFGSKKRGMEIKGSKYDDSSSLPDLPSLPDISTTNMSKINDIPQKNYSLPSFPNSQLGERVSQNTIKDAVIRSNSKNVTMLNIPGQRTTQEISSSESMPNIPSIMSRLPEIPMGNVRPRSVELSDYDNRSNIESRTRRTEPLFIKLDTFEKAISSFNEIKLRMNEIETLLRNIREVKVQEERELNDWENEIETVKSRLSQIDKDIFDKME